jgi:hypothetical protein
MTAATKPQAIPVAEPRIAARRARAVSHPESHGDRGEHHAERDQPGQQP